MSWLVWVLVILGAIGWAASSGSNTPAGAPSPPITSLDLRCGFGPYDNDVRGVVRAAPPSTEPHC